MRKSKVFSLALLATGMLAVSSCSNEDMPSPGQNDGNVTITAQLPAEMMTRAMNFGNGQKAVKLSYAVYNSGSTTPIAQMTVDGDDAITMSGLQATVNLKLVTGRTYDIIFFAQSEKMNSDKSDTKPYTVRWNGQMLDVNYAKIVSNDDDNDAFFVKHTVEVTGPVNEQVVLRRPFAQINFGSDDLKEASVIDAFGTDLKTSVKARTYTQLNLGNGSVANQIEVTYPFAACPDNEDFPYEPTKYSHLSMNYLLVPADRSIVDLELTVKNATQEINTLKVAAAPVQRNYRTNIYGSLLTSTADFQVVINPIFDQNDNNVGEIVTKEPVLNDKTKTYSINNAAELAWIASTVNEGNNLEGKTISIDADIDLGGFEWIPIGHTIGTTVLSADIEGNGHTIKNLTITNGGEDAAFVGYTWRKVKNLVFDGASVKGNHWAAVVVGHTQDGCPSFGVEDVTVKNFSVECTPWLVNGNYDDGDKVGAIIGYYPGIGGTTGGIKNCTVENGTVKGYRHIGGIAGYANWPITGCTVKNVKLVQDFLNGYKSHSSVDGLFGPINGNPSYDTSEGNTVSDITTEQINKD